MPLPLDDNRNPVQALHPLKCHVLDVRDDGVSVTPQFDADTVAVELQPDTDALIAFGQDVTDSNRVYLRKDGYYVYDPRTAKNLAAKAPEGGAAGKLIVTELG